MFQVMMFCFCLLMVIHTSVVHSEKLSKVPKEIMSHSNWKLLNQIDTCGRSTDGHRIVGGSKAHLGQYPWMARLGYNSPRNSDRELVDDYLCGGSIINNRYILTAAHCGPQYQDAELIQVRVGDYINKEEAEPTEDCEENLCAPPAQDYGVEEVVCHPGFDKEERNDDICLIRVSAPIKFHHFVKPICLPFYEDLHQPFTKQQMEVAGWGWTDSTTEKSSDILLTLKVPVLDHKACVEMYSQKGVLLGDKIMCAGGQKGKDSCGGDSGGPLMRKFFHNNDALYFQFGIVSFGTSTCAEGSIPAVYTRVDKYLMWILDNVHE